jgi:hypothetical protein
MTELASPEIPPLTRSQLERALLTSLADGPDQTLDHIQHVLALAQGQSAPDNVPYSPTRRPLTLTEARVIALTNAADYLTDAQLLDLYQEVQSCQDQETRLLCSIRLALWLPPQHFQAIIRTAWEEARAITVPEAQARVLLRLTPLLTLVHDEPAAPTVLLEVVSLAQAIGNIEARIRSLIALVPYLPHTMRVRTLHRVIDEIDRLHNDSQRATALCTLAVYLSTEVEARVLRSAESILVPAEKARTFTVLARYLPGALQTYLRHNALNVIGSISDEEERADALIAFAPHLEPIANSDQLPPLVEQALAIATSVKRRHLRARVLVALAPYLTADMQSEALAAVHNLGNERERAILLVALAPNLPPNLLVTSLAAARGMESPDARVHVLNALARYVPESAREQTVMDALTAAANLPHRYERVNALIDLMDILPPLLQDKTYTAALDAARLIENENARARALSMMSANLPTRLQTRALEVAQQLGSPQQRFSALCSLLPTLNGADRARVADELLQATRDLALDYKRARAIGEMAAALPPQRLAETLEIAQAIDDPMDRVTAFTAIIPHLPAEERRQVVTAAWQLIRAIDNGYDAASALAALAPLLPKAAAHNLARAAGMVIGSIMDEYDQASAITLLAPWLAAPIEDAGPLPDKYTTLESGIQAVLQVADPTLRMNLLGQAVELWLDISEPDQGYRLWQQVMQYLAALSFADALLALSVLLPVVRQQAGHQRVEQVAQLLNSLATLPVAESNQ